MDIAEPVYNTRIPGVCDFRLRAHLRCKSRPAVFHRLLSGAPEVDAKYGDFRVIVYTISEMAFLLIFCKIVTPS